MSSQPHLLTAQAFIPPTERTEVAGFDFVGDNDAIRAEVIERLNGIEEYRKLFGKTFPEVQDGGSITYDMFARAIAEFEFSLTFADAPIDRFARGQRNALTDDEKRAPCCFRHGALFRLPCGCGPVERDVQRLPGSRHRRPADRAAGDKQRFRWPGANEDFGKEQVTGDPADRYKFRTSPLRNVANSQHSCTTARSRTWRMRCAII